MYFMHNAALACIWSASGCSRFVKRQVNDTASDQDTQRAAAIKEIFKTAWNGYYEHAFPADELLPRNNSNASFYNGWSLTIVDALDTAALMGLDDIVDKSLDVIAKIDYTKDPTDTICSLFETNIRHIAGLLSAHDLFTGPLADTIKDLTQNQQKSMLDMLVRQAQTIADTLKFAFDTPTGIPSNGLYVNNRSTDNATDNNVAQVGTLVLEWFRLSDKTGNSKYGQLAQKGQDYLLQPASGGESFAGLIGIDISITNGTFLSHIGGWVGGVDSFYEYLLKMYVYDSTRFGFYKDRWVTAAESTIQHLVSHPSTRPDLTLLALYNGTEIIGSSQYLACFHGGNFILGGLVLEEPKYTTLGLKLADGCQALYASTRTGLIPALYRWIPQGQSPTNPRRVPPANQTAFYERNGFWITDPDYALTPEALETWYYAYRATGDRKYQDYIWRAVQSFASVCRVGSGYSEISDVNAPGGGEIENYQPSFFLAETLKYAYLAFAPGAAAQVSGRTGVDGQAWVFNTEAHPFRVCGKAGEVT